MKNKIILTLIVLLSGCLGRGSDDKRTFKEIKTQHGTLLWNTSNSIMSDQAEYLIWTHENVSDTLYVGKELFELEKSSDTIKLYFSYPEKIRIKKIPLTIHIEAAKKFVKPKFTE